uniref:Cortactin-binding protein-2 N-terminal domain-containing protein n=1 Tax=Strigamia maritima TaxID=126957 RepID=T1JE73_STRMM
MATKSSTATKSGAASTLESMDKLSSSTLKVRYYSSNNLPIRNSSIKSTNYDIPRVFVVFLMMDARNPKMELSKADLLKLLSYLEGELQAREVIIATLKAEKVKQLLQQVKLGGYNMDNPIIALQRDAFAACSPGFDELAVQAIYSNQLLALETLIDAQRCAHYQMKEQLVKIEQRHAKVLQELDDERCKHAHDTAQGDDVTYLLEKERGRLKQEVLQLEKGRLADMVDGLEEESQKSLQMEAELEQQLALFKEERNRLKDAIAAESDKTARLQDVNHSLVLEVATLKQKTLTEIPETTGTRVPISPDRPTVGSTSKQAVPPTPPIKPNQASKSNLASPASASTSPQSVTLCQKFATGRNETNPSGDTPLAQAGDTKIVHSTVSPGLAVTSKPVARLVHGIASAPNVQDISSEKPNIVTGTAPEKPSLNSVDAHSSTLGNKILTFGGKAPVARSNTTGHSQPPQPPKKPVAIVRGTPPPVPPNKPVLLAQAKRLSIESGEGDRKLTKPVPGATKFTKDKIGARPSDSSDTAKSSASDGGQVGSLLPPTASMDLLGQELADFQQLLVSMVNGKGIEMLSTEHISQTSSQGTS